MDGETTGVCPVLAYHLPITQPHHRHWLFSFLLYEWLPFGHDLHQKGYINGPVCFCLFCLQKVANVFHWKFKSRDLWSILNVSSWWQQLYLSFIFLPHQHNEGELNCFVVQSIEKLFSHNIIFWHSSANSKNKGRCVSTPLERHPDLPLDFS